MAVDSATANGVYLGAWIDWSRGRVLGATYTLSRQDGNLLIAFVAFFVALVGTRFWRLGCLVLHHVYSKDSPRDGVHHQRQVFLRNAPNPESALWTLINMGVSWRSNAGHVWTRLLLPMVVALASFVGFTLAGGFSSRVATIISSEVLMSGEGCSVLRPANNMSTYGDTVGTMLAESMIAAEGYARQCYSSTPSGTAVGVSCNTYVKKQMAPSVVDTNASCPFDVKMCKNASGNLFIDTGFLDSNDDFGRNSPPNRRFQFRRTVHCAPLATEGYRFGTYDQSNQSYTTYYYGPLQNIDESITVNYTTQLSDDVYPDIEELTHNAVDTVHDFSIRLHYSRWLNGSRETPYSSFVPIPELKLENSIVSIFFLTSGRILFTSPSNDGWYGETTNTTQVHRLKFTSAWGNATFFRQSEPGSPLGCREQEQYCYTGVAGRKCTPLQSSADSHRQLLHVVAEEEDVEWLTARWDTTVGRARRLYDPLQMLGTRILVARNKLSGPILGPLQDNQWQLEVQHWHATAMAYLQYLFLQSIMGYKDRGYSSEAVQYLNDTAAQRAECTNQKIIAEGFVSVSIFGLACIFVIGAFIIIFSYAFGPVLKWCLTRTGRYQYAKLEWATTDAFQLQRMAHEGTGMGTWSRGTQSIPVTQPGDLLAALDVTNSKHPKLRAYVQSVDDEQADRESDEDHDVEEHGSGDHGSTEK